MVDLRWLRAAAVVESVSLLLLVVNLATVHVDAVAALVGPIHGTAWLATIATACLVPVPTATRWMAGVPGIGGLLALAHARRRP